MPAELGSTSTHWAIDYLYQGGERLVLKILPDKGWYELIPQSETSFYHLSNYDDFTVTFELDESGHAAQFLYETSTETYTFVRLMSTPIPPTSTPAPPTATLMPPTATPVPPAVTGAPPTAAATPRAAGAEGSGQGVYWLWWTLPALALVAAGVWFGARKRT